MSAAEPWAASFQSASSPNPARPSSRLPPPPGPGTNDPLRVRVSQCSSVFVPVPISSGYLQVRPAMVPRPPLPGPPPPPPSAVLAFGFWLLPFGFRPRLIRPLRPILHIPLRFRHSTPRILDPWNPSACARPHRPGAPAVVIWSFKGRSGGPGRALPNPRWCKQTSCVPSIGVRGSGVGVRGRGRRKKRSRISWARGFSGFWPAGVCIFQLDRRRPRGKIWMCHLR